MSTLDRAFIRAYQKQRVIPAPHVAFPAAERGSGAMLDQSAEFNLQLYLVHLARQCLGDHELEAELLALFRVQACALTGELSGSPLLSLEAKAKIAHKLRGSALAIGAGRVASAASLLEELTSAPGDQRSAEAHAVDALLSAVAEALAEIERIRG